MICPDCKWRIATKWCPQCGAHRCVACLREHKALFNTYSLPTGEATRADVRRMILRAMKDATR